MELLKCALYVLALGFAANVIGNSLPREWFHPDRFPFRCFGWEKSGKVYRKLCVRNWKDRLPDMSKVDRRMYRKEVDPKAGAENLNRLVQETCVAETVHVGLIILSLGVVRIWRSKWGWFCWFLCVLGNLPFIIIQRFNRPRLQQALKRQQLRN